MTILPLPAGWPSKCTRVIIIVHRFPGHGGIETFTSNMADAARARGLDVDVISVYPGSGTTMIPTSIVFLHDQLHLTSVTGRRIFSLRTWLLLPRLLFKRFDGARARARLRRTLRRRGEETLVIITKPEFGRLLNQIGITAQEGMPILVGQHHSSFESLVHTKHLPEEMARDFSGVDAFAALTDSDTEQFSAVLSVPCVTIPNLVAPLARRMHVAGSVGSPLAEGPWSHDRRNLAVAFARLSPEKQLDRMIRNFLAATANSRLRDWKLEIHGEGAERERLQRLIDDSPDGNERVTLMGWTDDKDDVYARSKINLLTSSFEGFGMTIVESAQNAVCTLAYGCSPGVTDLIETLGGIAVKADDDDAFVGQLSSLLASGTELEHRGVTARSRVRRYEPDRVLEDWAKLVGRAYARRSSNGHK